MEKGNDEEKMDFKNRLRMLKKMKNEREQGKKKEEKEEGEDKKTKKLDEEEEKDKEKEKEKNKGEALFKLMNKQKKKEKQMRYENDSKNEIIMEEKESEAELHNTTLSMNFNEEKEIDKGKNEEKNSKEIQFTNEGDEIKQKLKKLKTEKKEIKEKMEKTEKGAFERVKKEDIIKKEEEPTEMKNVINLLIAKKSDTINEESNIDNEDIKNNNNNNNIDNEDIKNNNNNNNNNIDNEDIKDNNNNNIDNEDINNKNNNIVKDDIKDNNKQINQEEKNDEKIDTTSSDEPMSLMNKIKKLKKLNATFDNTNKNDNNNITESQNEDINKKEEITIQPNEQDEMISMQQETTINMKKNALLIKKPIKKERVLTKQPSKEVDDAQIPFKGFRNHQLYFSEMKGNIQKNYSPKRINNAPSLTNVIIKKDINLSNIYKNTQQRVNRIMRTEATQSYKRPVAMIYSPKKRVGGSFINQPSFITDDLCNYSLNTFNPTQCTQNYDEINYSPNTVRTKTYTIQPKKAQILSKRKEKFQINLEDLMILEEKLSDIILAINSNQNIRNECFEWWNYFFNCSLFNTIEKAFKNEFHSLKVQMSIKYELLSILLCYDLSFNKDLMSQVLFVLKEMLNLNYDNLIILCEYILSKVSSTNLNNIWVFKLRNLIRSSKIGKEDIQTDTMSTIEKICFNMDQTSKDIRIVLRNYTGSDKQAKLTSLYKNISNKTYQDIKDFFQEHILHVDNLNASVLASVVLRESGMFRIEKPPYFKTKSIHPYTLVLDLDETLVYFKFNPKNEFEGILSKRPGLSEFLDEVGKFYDIAVWTCATAEYADMLIDVIEENKIYFDFRLYRQHSIIVDNDFVKDLSRLGRPLDQVIIVDNMPQNFRLQKENGIHIKAYWGEEQGDRALYDLKEILIAIAKENDDVRNSIRKYKDEIVRKVTSNMSKMQF